ncbi:DNA replication protein DnaC [bacterium HR23]|nr:DNA replication protein DnaC [bacterium HR23]
MKSDAPLGDPNFGKVVPCTCKSRVAVEEQYTRLVRLSGLGALRRCTFASLAPQGRSGHPEDQRCFAQALEVAKAFAESPSGWLVLTGPSGSGKTHLAAAIVNRCLERGQVAVYISTPDLLDRLRSTFAPWNSAPYDTLFEQVCTVPVLVLDDLGAHSATPWAEEKLFQVLNARWRDQLPTVVVLSAPLPQVEERFRTRLTDPQLSRVLTLGVWGEKPFARLAPEWEHMTFATFRLEGNRATEAQRRSLEEAYRAARAVAQGARQWLVLMGPPGCGKTHLAVAIYQERLRRGEPALIARVADLLDYLRSAFAPESRVSYDQRFDELRNAPLLILDDLPAQVETRWSAEKLHHLLLYRYDHHLPTVLTMSSEEGEGGDILASISPALRSRLKDQRLVTLVRMDAPDYRDRARSASRHHGRER